MNYTNTDVAAPLGTRDSRGRFCKADFTDNGRFLLAQSGRSNRRPGSTRSGNVAPIQPKVALPGSAERVASKVTFGKRVTLIWRRIIGRFPSAKAEGSPFLTYGRELSSRQPSERASGEYLDWLIMACITSGINQRDAIIRFIPRVAKFSHRHVGYNLNLGTGQHPGHHLWSKNDNAEYELVERDDLKLAA